MAGLYGLVVTMHLKNVTPNVLRMQRLIEIVRQSGVKDVRTLEALARVPRELFVSRTFAAEAYEDKALPIGESQTISMPTVVARMTEALGLKGHERVLEIGTGCGYQTAILCRVAKRVFSIERRKALSDAAVSRLQAMGYTNFTPLVGDGTLGWPQQAPFEAIIVTAAGPKIPQNLTDQLAVGGRLVIPVGATESNQRLMRVTKSADGELLQEVLGPVVFVPLVGEQGVTLKRA